MDFDQFAEALRREALSDAAQSFFGPRVEIDREVELYEQAAAEVRRTGEAAARRAALLVESCLGPTFAAPLFESVSPGLSSWLTATKEVRPDYNFELPWALTVRGQYVRLLQRVYGLFVESVDVYREGREYRDARYSNMPRRTPSLSLLHQWGEDLNRRIRELNESKQASHLAQFTRNMDQCRLEQERVASSAVAGVYCALDDGLSLACVPCPPAGLPDLPTPPSADAAAEALKTFGREQYRLYPEDVVLLLKRLGERAAACSYPRA